MYYFDPQPVKFGSNKFLPSSLSIYPLTFIIKSSEIVKLFVILSTKLLLKKQVLRFDECGIFYCVLFRTVTAYLYKILTT